MDSLFYIIRENRKTFIRLIDSLSIDELNEIPTGFNNNLAWNFAHIVVTQQILCYAKAGLPYLLEEQAIEKYQRGSKPEQLITLEELNFYKQQATELIDAMEADWNAGKFAGYKPFTTSMGVTIRDAEDALIYTSTHDQLHFGYCLSLKRTIRQKKSLYSQ
ncbi:MAG: DinB family protein [Chitinophagaceae bacterium]|nr:DinB family protein [Chitinophagaceae bacterium]